MAKCTRPIVAILKTGAVFDFTQKMEAIVRHLLTDLVSPKYLYLPNAVSLETALAASVCIAMPAQMASVRCWSKLDRMA